jgi:hypothetical protein
MEISMFSLCGIKGYNCQYLGLHLYTHEMIASCLLYQCLHEAKPGCHLNDDLAV